MNANLASEYMRRYGNSAFGIISLLIIWFAIVRPELVYTREQSVHLQQLVTEMQRMTVEQQKVSKVVVDNQRQIIENTTQLQRLIDDKGC